MTYHIAKNCFNENCELIGTTTRDEQDKLMWNLNSGLIALTSALAHDLSSLSSDLSRLKNQVKTLERKIRRLE